MAGCPCCLGTIACLAPTWQKLGKRRRGRQCQVASTPCSCLPSPSWRASPYFRDRKQTHRVYNTMFAAVYLGTGSSKSCQLPWCCALSCWRKSKGAENFHERQSKGLTLCFNLPLSQIFLESDFLFYRCVDLGGEFSAGFLFEM